MYASRYALKQIPLSNFEFKENSFPNQSNLDEYFKEVRIYKEVKFIIFLIFCQNDNKKKAQTPKHCEILRKFFGSRLAMYSDGICRRV